jgi:DNA-binding GntR family transcriptional regulator
MSPRRRYDEIAAHFRRLIQDGELAPGDQLPSLRKVCETFDVAMNTANRAFQVLKAEGLTTATLDGTVVAEQTNVSTSGVARIRRLEKTGREYAPGETSTDHVAMLRSVGDPKWAQDLGLDLHDEVLIRRRVFRSGGKPSSVAFSIFHPRAWAVVPELLQQGQLKPFWQKTYAERTGKDVHASPEQRGARLAYEEEVEALEVEVPEGTPIPVLVLYTTFHTEDGPIEVWEDVQAPGTWHISPE